MSGRLFSTTVTNHWQPGGTQRKFTFAVGAFDPWRRFETYPTPNTPFRFGVDIISGSICFLIVGFAHYYVVWRIEKPRKPNPGWWNSPVPMAIIWALWAVLAIGMGTKAGFDALDDRPAEESVATPNRSHAKDDAEPGSVPLVAAAVRGDVTEVARLLDAGYSVNDKDAGAPDGKFLLFYNQHDLPHKFPRHRFASSTSRAAIWPADRLAALVAAGHGEFTTAPLVLRGDTITLNFQAPRSGGLEVELRDERFRIVPGHSFADCDPLHGDHLAAPVRWRGASGVSSWRGQAVYLRFRLRNARLFSLSAR